MWGLAKFSALTTTFVGVALHLMGSAYHRIYLATWGIDTGLFQKSTDWILVSAYYVLIDRTALVILQISKYVTAFAVIGLLITLALWMNRLPRVPASDEATRSYRRMPASLESLLYSAVQTYTGFAALLIAPLLIFLVLIFPPLQGELVGESIAEEHMQALENGCPERHTTVRCVTVLRNGQSIAHGFVIDSSTTHIAIFDVATREARAIERHGLELKAEHRSNIADAETE